MNWFDQWLSKKMQRAWNAERDSERNVKMEIHQLVSSTNSVGNKRGLDVYPSLNFRLHHAENGWIVEVNNHDQRTDRHTTKLHLIGDDEEFDKAICQIITLEALRG